MESKGSRKRVAAIDQTLLAMMVPWHLAQEGDFATSNLEFGMFLIKELTRQRVKADGKYLGIKQPVGRRIGLSSSLRMKEMLDSAERDLDVR